MQRSPFRNVTGSHLADPGVVRRVVAIARALNPAYLLAHLFITMSLKLVQFPWSTYCMVTRAILRFGGIQHEIINIPPLDRSLPWRLSGHRSYRVPLLVDDDAPVVESDHDTQVIARYLDERFKLGLFPAHLDGVQTILWRYIENEVEDPAFRLNDIYFREWLPEDEQLRHLQYKERRFGPSCIDQWSRSQSALLDQLTDRLEPFEFMLAHHAFLLDESPRFVDLDLAAMLECFLWSGRYELPAKLPRVRDWHQRINAAACSS